MTDTSAAAATEPAATGADDPAPPAVTAVGIVVATRRNTRRRNEDAVGVGGWVLQGDSPAPVGLSVPVSPARPVLVAVADGMGGHPAGDLAARVAADHLTRSDPEPRVDLEAAFVRADEAIHRTTSPEGPGMGATACLVRVSASGSTVVANLGDVRAYRLTGGYLGRLTVDDRATAPAGAAPSSAVTRHLGGYRRIVVEPHVHGQQLGPGDRLLLCSDGLHDAVPAERIAHLLAGDDALAVAERLVAEAGEAGDNVTVVVVDLQGIDSEEPTSNTGRLDSAPLPTAVASALDGVLSAPGRRARSR